MYKYEKTPGLSRMSLFIVELFANVKRFDFLTLNLQ